MRALAGLSGFRVITWLHNQRYVAIRCDPMRRFVSSAGRLAFTLILWGCRHPQVEWACDVLRFDDSNPERSVVVVHTGTGSDSALRSTGAGNVTLHARRIYDSAEVDGAIIRVRQTGKETNLVSPDSRALYLTGPAGAYDLTPRCIGCARATARHKIVVGRRDTIDFYMSRARPVCEAPGNKHAAFLSPAT